MITGLIENQQDVIYEARELINQCEGNTALMAKMVFPHRFRFPFSPLHQQIFDALDDEMHQKVMVIAPRGFGKTTILLLAYAAKRILFGQSRYIVPISNSSMNAIAQTEKLKSELLYNHMIKKLWGNQKGDWFTKDYWETESGAIIMPRGAGQQVRGLSGDNRPDLILLDDMESSEGVMSELQRDKTKHYIQDDVLNAVDYKLNNWRVCMIGSMLHEDSYLANIKDEYDADIKAGRDPDWLVVDLSICNENYKSNWPEAFSDAFIMKKRNEYAKKGMLDSFAREFMSMSASPDENFQKKFFQHYREGELPSEIKNRLQNVVLLDPAKTVKTTSCDAAIVVWGIDLIGGGYYLRDVRREKFHPNEAVNVSLAMCQRWKAKALGIEVTSLNEWITYPFLNEMSRTARWLPLIELHARGSKVERSGAMIQYYENKQVYHEESIAAEIEIPLLSWPRCKMWDVIDAASYLPAILSNCKQYLLAPLGDLGFTDEAVYKKLKEEDAKQPRLRRRSVA